jgi:hypothetical protein
MKQSLTFLLFLLPLGMANTAAIPNTFTMQQLVCRGKTGLEIPVYQKPSPTSNSYVRMVLKYAKPGSSVGSNYENLAPGACSWNPHNFTGVPAEPGVLYIDIVPEAQRWAGPETRQLDTTVNAAVFFRTQSR